MVQHYKVLARFTPFNTDEEFITLKGEGYFEDIITFCASDEFVKFSEDLQEGDIVEIESITTIRKV